VVTGSSNLFSIDFERNERFNLMEQCNSVVGFGYWRFGRTKLDKVYYNKTNVVGIRLSAD